LFNNIRLPRYLSRLYTSDLTWLNVMVGKSRTLWRCCKRTWGGVRAEHTAQAMQLIELASIPGTRPRISIRFIALKSALLYRGVYLATNPAFIVAMFYNAFTDTSRLSPHLSPLQINANASQTQRPHPNLGFYSFLQPPKQYVVIYFSGRDYPVESNKNASSLSQHFEVAFSFALFWET
jgi:hypothetical protein